MRGTGIDGSLERTCKATDREWSRGREKARRGSTFVAKRAHTCQAVADVHAPSTRAPIFLLCARTLAYRPPLVHTRALANLSCPKRLSGGPNKRQTTQRPLENRGIRGRGAIALNSNRHSGNQKSTAAANPCRRFASSKPRLSLSHQPTLVFECFFPSKITMQTSVHY